MRVISPFVVALSLALVAPAAFIGSSIPTQAQQSGSPGEPPKQVALTAQQIEGFIAAQNDVNAILSKQPQDASEQPDPKVAAALDAAVKKYNFANYAEYDDVASNIGLVMNGMDPQSKKFVGAETVLKEQIAEVKADKTMSPKDKRDQLEQLRGELASPAPAPSPGNIALVTKYYDKLAAAGPQGQE